MKKIAFVLMAFLAIASSGFTQAQILMSMPGHNNTFTGNTRGYWFTSPTCFTITGLRVPTDASTGNQSIAVVRLDAIPPSWSTTTNNFDLLYLVQDTSASGILPVDIKVNNGDIIGILGVRGNANSYGSNNQTTTINGQTTTLTRLGFQQQMASNAPNNLWTESGGSISRVEMYYDTVLTYSIGQTITGASVDLTNGAAPSMTSIWDYGDGSGLDTVYNPTHTYSADGVYNVCSYITDGCGNMDTVCTSVIICAISPTALFTSSASGLATSFTDSSTNAASWMWDFGDGNTDTTQNPTHTYTGIGTYVVCLTSTSSCGAFTTYCDTITVCTPPVSSFASNYMGAGMFNFADSSDYAQSWTWDFGDGVVDTTQNPSHTYSMDGTYTVCLITTNFCGSDTQCVPVTACLSTPSAAFSSAVSEDTATFTNASTNASTYWWDFGDGNTSTMMDPTHIYTMNGDFVVCLSAINGCGDTTTTCDTVNICRSPIASFTSQINASGNGEVVFTNTGSPGPAVWDFGDGNTSMAPNPTHTYATTGMYEVCLILSNICGSDTTCETINVTVVGISDPLGEATVNLFPNPFTDITTLRVTGSGVELKVELLDNQGKMVRTQEGHVNEDMMISRGDLAAGLYLYRVSVDGRLLGTGRLSVK